MPLAPGHLVNQRYEIRALIGPDGPMEVYRALDLRMGREVALTVLELSGMHDPASLLRFESAAQARGRIRHPNLTVLHDFGQEGSQVFIAAEWMEGESLRRRLARSPMDWAEARPVAQAILRVLAVLHEHGILVKDLDPSGVHLEPGGCPRLLAYWVESAAAATAVHGNPALQSLVQILLEMVRERRKTVPPDILARLEAWAGGDGVPDPRAFASLLEAPPSPRRRLPWVLGSLAAAALLALGVALSRREPPSGRAATSVVVIPLASEASAPGSDYLGPGLTGILADSLAREPAIRVVAGAPGAAEPDRDPANGARSLGAEFVLSGRYHQSEGRLRVTLELVRAQDGVLLWQEQFDRPMSELLSLASDLSGRAIETLARRAGPRSSKPMSFQGTGDPEAYRLYLQGRHWLMTRDLPAFQRAKEAFQGAIARDPGFARAYSGLADATNLMGVWGAIPPAEVGDKATVASRKALALDPDLAEAHASLAYTQFRFLWDWQGAEEEFRQALRLDPAYAQGHHWFAFFLSLLGRWEESMEHFRRAGELDPLNLPSRVNYAVALHWTGREPESLQEFAKVLEQDPGYQNGIGRYLDTLEGMGRFQEALRLYEHQEQRGWIAPEDVRHLRNALGSQGDRGYLAERIRQMEKAGSHPVAIAEMVALAGDTERAFRLLERAVREHSAFAVWIPRDPAFARMRKDPRFASLLARIRFPGG